MRENRILPFKALVGRDVIEGARASRVLELGRVLWCWDAQDHLGSKQLFCKVGLDLNFILDA